MRSIKTKLILGVTALIIILFAIAGLLLINEKKHEHARDIYTQARAVSELTTPSIVNLYSSLLKEDGFVLFNRGMVDIFKKDEDISYIKLFTFGGELLYDSVDEKYKRYQGPTRTVGEPNFLARVKAHLPSVHLDTGRVIYIKKTPDGSYQTVDENEQPTAEVLDNERIFNIVYPFDEQFAVEFGITYENLQARLLRTAERIILLVVFGILIGLGFAWVFSGRITVPIEKLTASAVIIGQGDFSARVAVQTKDEVGVLAQTFNKMASELQEAMKAMLYKERVAKELEVAAKIQKQIIPKTLPKIPGLDIATALIPAAEIGGDCYDFIQVDPKTHITYIGDVTGHGIPAGIVVSIVNAIIYSYAHTANLKEILVNANKVMKQKAASNMFMTTLMLRYETTGKLEYVSAGHPEMVHYFGKEKRVATEAGGGIALGMIPDNSKMIKTASINFEVGDYIVLYSDGIPEAASPRGEFYGIQRLKRAVSGAGDLETAEAVKNVIVADVKEYMAGAEQLDDITVVVLKRTN